MHPNPNSIKYKCSLHVMLKMHLNYVTYFVFLFNVYGLFYRES